MSRYLVTGGAGFIGSHIVAALLQRGHQVVVLDDLSTGRRSNLEGVEREVPGAAHRLDFIEASLLDEAALDTATVGVDAAFHEAAIPSVPRSFADPATTLRANVEGTGRLLEACRENRVGRVVFASSSSAYGDTPELPKREEMPPNPLSPYALSKQSAEVLCRIWADQYGIETVALRYFNVYGPRQDPGSEYAAVVPKFIQRLLDGRSPVIYGDGEQSRDFTYVGDAVAANLLAGGLGRESTETDTRLHGEVVNIGGGERHTVLELVELLRELTGRAAEPEFAPPRPGDVRHSLADTGRARELLGYRPRVDFKEGLRRTVEWFRKTRENGLEASPDRS